MWWRDILKAWNGKALISGAPDLIIETDASLRGWGGILQRDVHRGPVVSRKVSFAHKFPRTPCLGICFQDLCERQNSNEALSVNGHNCSPLHKQDGRHQILCPRQSGSTSLEVLLLITTSSSNRGGTYREFFIFGQAENPEYF